MSIVQPPIDLSSIGNSFQITPPGNLQSENIGWIVLLNESPYTLTFFAGGMQLSIPAWDEYPIQVAKRVNGQIIVLSSFSLPITIESMLLASLPSSQSTQLVVSFFALGEVPPSTSPRNLNRQTWIPNNVNTVGNNVSNILQNDGSTPGTQFLESTPSDAVSSTWSFKNDGTGFVKGDNGGVLTQILQFVAGANPGLIFGNHNALGATIDSTIGLNMKPDNDVHRAQVIAPNSGTQSANLLEVYDNVPNLQLFIGPLGQLGLNKPLNYNQSGTVLNGGTSGTVTVNEVFSGTPFKVVLGKLNNFRTGASAQNLTLPTAFVNGALIFTGSIGTSAQNGGFSCLSSGVAQNIDIITSLATTGGGVTGQNTIFTRSIGECRNAFDTLQFTASGTQANNGFFLIVGQ